LSCIISTLTGCIAINILSYLILYWPPFQTRQSLPNLSAT